MKKKIDYLGHLVEFVQHEIYIKEQRELTKNKDLPFEDKWIYRINGGVWKDGGKTLFDFTGFLYSHKTPESLLKSYNDQSI